MSTSSTAKTRSRPNSEFVLYSYGEPVAMTNDSGTSYFGTDILGSVRSVTDKYGTVQADYSYDAFGSPYLGNLENDIGFGYCGKVYDVGTGLYDYGFRDYSPVSARFTTIDPIRDGSNWFSYCMNDAVNYKDYLGLFTIVDEINNALKNVPGEVIYVAKVPNASPYIYLNSESSQTVTTKTNSVETASFDNNYLKVYANTSLTKSNNIPLDAVDLPDGAIYKTWSGSKVYVEARSNGTYSIMPSLGTIVMNGLGNVMKTFSNIGIAIDNMVTSIKNNYRSEGEKQPYKEYNELYGYYSANEVNRRAERHEKEKNKDNFLNTIGAYKNMIISNDGNYYAKSGCSTK
ncbi:MAG: RHS repeat-associated core domain-containing protein [Spirochaetaceae bacterium]|nr:RHS repeat-associated core domain-containing protein [Spirochaetaceae bacterium]